MNITLIAAMGTNNAIGKDGKLPWHCKEDLEWFKANTRDKSVIMGRKTYESIGRPLPDRHNFVLTRDEDFTCDERVILASSAHMALGMAALINSGEVMVMGGGEVYEQFMPRADKLLITHFDHSFDGDAFFPDIDPSIWEGRKVRDGDTSTAELSFSFWEYTRKS